mmetsp:Transcript_113045/g.200391  ORF Transcript_113045/g.200391 Transcript_113045/m.200391 type:complete len:252 (+) Transcript_113045:115-870(+)
MPTHHRPMWSGFAGRSSCNCTNDGKVFWRSRSNSLRKRSISSVCRFAASMRLCLVLTSRKLVWARRIAPSFSSMRPPPPMTRGFWPSFWPPPPEAPPCGARRRRMCSLWMTFCCSSRNFFSSMPFSIFLSLVAWLLIAYCFFNDCSFCCVVVFKCSIFRSSRSASALLRPSSPPFNKVCKPLVTRNMCTSLVRSSKSLVCKASILCSQWMRLSFLRNSLVVSSVPTFSLPSSKMRRFRLSTTSLSMTTASE